MSITSSIKTIQDEEHPDNFWVSLKISIINKLYEKQTAYWNTDMVDLIQEIAAIEDVHLTKEECHNVAIHHNNAVWRALPLIWLVIETVPSYYFSLAGKDPELIAKFEKSATELQTLKRERYESERFLSSLILFQPEADVLKSVLGDNLFNLVRSKMDHAPEAKDIYLPTSLSSFLEKNQSIIEHIRERMLINLIMADVLKE